jgi:serine/threonine-protein kinase
MTQTADRLAAALADRYRIERELGAGGMATVYLAQDLRHEREVAIKVLHPDLGATLGSDRFLSEIRTTARLQHPHILPLLDSGEADGLLYYVMPRVMGETLRAKLDRERQLPIEDAVRISREVADALEYAHTHGVIHRDIKPENILVQGGHALVADFGIALAVQQAAGSRMTQTGLSLGTPQYMSPEQAMGERTIDARSDVYALGAVAYEMLTGDPPFTGSTVQAIVAKIMTEKPTPVRALRDTVPTHVERAVNTALAKLPADRFASAEAFRAALGAAGTVEPATATAPRALSRVSPRAALLGMAVVATVSLALAGWAWLGVERGTAGTTRLTLLFEELYDDAEEGPIISPDDRAFISTNRQSELILREESSREGRVIPGTRNSWSPFFSPDGGSLAYMTGFPGDLRVVDLGTMTTRTLLADSAISYGGSWSDDGWLYYIASLGRAVMRIRPNGGSSELVARVDSSQSELFFRFPNALPGGRGLLLTRWKHQGEPDIVHLDLASGDMRVITAGLRAWYVESGHLVVARPDGVISAMRFSPRSGEVRGRPVELDREFRVVTGGVPIVSVSRRGTILFIRSEADNRLVRVSRTGQHTVVDPTTTGRFRSLAISPDGTRAALSVKVGGRLEVWVKHLDDGPFTRVATAGSYAYRLFWSPDSRSIGFVSDLPGLPGLFSVPANGSGRVEPLPAFAASVDEGMWTRDGRWLVVRAGSGAGRDIYGVPLQGDGAPVPLAATDMEEYSPTVSPDGRWLAYGSDGSGQDEIYVMPFGGAREGKYQASVAGGSEPVWSHSGRELFYRDLADNLVALSIAPGGEFRVLSRRVLFSAGTFIQDVRNRTYGVSPDDQSFYFVDDAASTSRDGVVMVRNWIAEAERAIASE